MNSAVRKLNFEKAQQLKKEIEALKSTLEKIRFREVSEQEILAHLNKSNILEDLKTVLHLKKLPCRIEALDISNLNGQEAAGSLVVFENAEPNKNEYRRFKIKTVTGIDDPRMIAEVVERRYSRRLLENTGFPDLILIDGGLPQINMVQKKLDQLGLSGLPIIGLAKKEEEIYFPNNRQSLRLPKNSRALHLLQAVRDEAHRFAIAYHHLLRKKTIKTKEEKNAGITHNSNRNNHR